MSRLESWPRFAKWIGRQGVWRRIFVFLGLLAIAWLPLALPLYWLGKTLDAANATDDYSDIAEIVALVLLYGGFLIGLPCWGRWVHHWVRPWKQCGLLWNKQTPRQLIIALAIGALGVFALFGVETLLGWAVPSEASSRILRFVIEGLVMALAVAFAEEMLFRGWMLTELEQNYSGTAALVWNALLFAGAHFITVKPLSEVVRSLPQFFGLVLLGMALVWARRGSRGGRFSALGYPIGLHAGLIWGYYIVNVGGLIEYSGRVPQWVTGIDDNPLAGLLGLVLLGAIAAQFAKIAQPKSNAPSTTTPPPPLAS